MIFFLLSIKRVSHDIHFCFCFFSSHIFLSHPLWPHDTLNGCPYIENGGVTVCWVTNTNEVLKTSLLCLILLEVSSIILSVGLKLTIVPDCSPLYYAAWEQQSWAAKVRSPWLKTPRCSGGATALDVRSSPYLAEALNPKSVIVLPLCPRDDHVRGPVT